MIQIAICDDEEIIRKQIGNTISYYFSTKQIDYKIHYYESGVDLLNANDKIHFSFIFLDIQLGEHNGVQIAQLIRTKQSRPINIVFITSYAEYQTKVLSIHIFDYLIKPVNKDRIYKVLDDLMFWYNKEETNQQERIRFKTINGILTIFIDDLVYFEYSNRRINIVTKNNIYYMYGKIKDINKKMARYNFISPHAAYIINMNEIKQYYKSDNKVIMTDGKEIPISQLKAKGFRESYMNFIDAMWQADNT